VSGDNPLVAQRQDSTTWHSGINIVDDAAGVYDGVSSGNWVEGGIAAFGVGLDALSMAMNPVGTLISYGLNWLIEHVKPLQDALNQLAGDADQIAAYAQTWKNVGEAVSKAAKDLADTVTADTASWTGQAADAYRASIGTKVDHINAAAKCANTIGTAVQIVGVITGAVRMLVRDMITQAIGDFVQDALEEVFSLGLGTPVVVAQVVSQVADWVDKIAGVIKKLINSVEKLRPLMSKLEEIFAAIKKVMSELHGRGPEEPSMATGDGTHIASADEPHTTTAGDGTHPASGDGSTSPASSGDGTTPAGSTGGPGDTSTPGGTRPSSEDGGGGGQRSEGNGGCDGKGGDPVDVVSGQMITDKIDVDLPGLLPLTIRRAYASGFGGGRLFGPGWSSTLDQRLEIDHQGIQYVGDDAQVLRYPDPRPGEQVLPDYGARWPLTWDRGSDTIRVEDPETGWTRHFGPNPAEPGRRPISALTDRDNHRIDYVRDENGLPVAVEHSGGYRVEVDTVDGPAGARISALRLVGITAVSYRYDARGCLTGIVDSSGFPYRYEYDEADRITAWFDRNNFSYRYIYGEDGRVIRGEGLGGYLNARFDYDLERRITTVTNSLGQATRYHYDSNNHIAAVVDPLGHTETIEFDRYHRLLSHTDPLGNTIRYVRDEQGDPVRVEYPDGTRVDVEYDLRWRMPTQVTRPGGAVWRHTYSATGNLVTTTDPMGAVVGCVQDDRGHMVASIEPDGQRWGFASNGAGRPLSVTNPLGATARYDYDDFGRLRSMTDSHGALTRYGWTIEGQLAWQTGPDGDRDELFYDRQGNLVERRSAVGATTRFEVGPFNLPVARTGQDGTRYTFAYNTELRLVRVTNPVGLTWDYEYDAAGNRISETDFTGRRITYRHDAAGRVAARTEQSAQTVELDRDSAGRVVAQRIDGEGTVEFEYDPAGQLLRAADGTTELTYQRDLLGRPLLESINDRPVRSEYDLLGRRTRRLTPSGIESVWQYTPIRKEASLVGTGGSLSFGYDVGGRETARRMGADVTMTQAFDDQGRLTAQSLWGDSDRPIQHRTFRYRADGLVTAVSDQLGGDRSYALTPAGRVTAVTAETWTERYTYDALGNLATAEPGTAADAAGPRALDGFLLRSAGRSSYEYDTLGRLVRETRRTLSGQRRIWGYTWNGRNQLAGVSTPDGQQWRYVYDPLGRRVAKQRVDEAGSVLDEVTFSWDGASLAEQWQTSGPQVTATTWDYRGGTGEPVAQTSRSWLADAPDTVIDSRFHAIVSDLIGSPTELLDATGRIAWRQTISLWGNRIALSTPDGVECPLRFPGQYHDPETGLHYNFHRYYDPQTARYLTPDPLGLPPSPNHYAYVVNPLTICDPFGLAGVRDPQGRYASDPLSPPTGHNRSTEYPHDYWDSTHDAMASKWTVEGMTQGGVPVDSSGVKIPRDQLTWVDAQGNPVPFDELTYDHNPPVVEHWNSTGYDQTAADREAWYNNTDDMEAMTRSENSSKGAKLQSRYSDRDPGPNYSCS
jgi:RHS repeat-associated protein